MGRRRPDFEFPQISPSPPAVVDSRVIELADPTVPHSRQPYHAGFGTAQSDIATVTSLVRGIERFSRRAIKALVDEYSKHHRIRTAAVVVASLTDPASIANQHMRAHASEGQLFRRVLVDGLERCGVKVRVVLEREVYGCWASPCGRPGRCETQNAELGEAVARWRAEQKGGGSGAWLVS